MHLGPHLISVRGKPGRPACAPAGICFSLLLRLPAHSDLIRRQHATRVLPFFGQSKNGFGRSRAGFPGFDAPGPCSHLPACVCSWRAIAIASAPKLQQGYKFGFKVVMGRPWLLLALLLAAAAHGSCWQPAGLRAQGDAAAVGEAGGAGTGCASAAGQLSRGRRLRQDDSAEGMPADPSGLFAESPSPAPLNETSPSPSPSPAWTEAPPPPPPAPYESPSPAPSPGPLQPELLPTGSQQLVGPSSSPALAQPQLLPSQQLFSSPPSSPALPQPELPAGSPAGNALPALQPPPPSPTAAVRPGLLAAQLLASPSPFPSPDFLLAPAPEPEPAASPVESPPTPLDAYSPLPTASPPASEPGAVVLPPSSPASLEGGSPPAPELPADRVLSSPGPQGPLLGPGPAPEPSPAVTPRRQCPSPSPFLSSSPPSLQTPRWPRPRTLSVGGSLALALSLALRG